MRKLIGAAVIAAALAMAGSAQAADMPLKAPVVVAPFTWTGIYLGINAGYGNSTSDGDQYCTNPAGIVSGVGCWRPNSAAVSPSGGFVGGQLGGNYQTGMFVWGVEADIQVAHINGSSTLNDSCCFPIFGLPLTTGVLTRTQNLDWFGTVRGRLGLAIWDRTLVYGTGGVMFGEEVLNSNLVFPLVGYQAQTSSTHTGWVAGGGIEYAFTDRISAKVEGLYYNMGSETIAASTAVAPNTIYTDTTSFTYKGALVRLGANLKFGP
jgi:outer membrane immunogenic protein